MVEVVLASSSTRRRIWISEMLEGAGVDLSFFDLRDSEPEPVHGSEVRIQVEQSCTHKAIEASKFIFLYFNFFLWKLINLSTLDLLKVLFSSKETFFIE